MLLQYVLEGMLVYPNKMDFPVMENFGVSPPPLGMLEITIERAEGLINSDFLSKSDPYCEVLSAAHPGRPSFSDDIVLKSALHPGNQQYSKADVRLLYACCALFLTAAAQSVDPSDPRCVRSCRSGRGGCCGRGLLTTT